MRRIVLVLLTATVSVSAGSDPAAQLKEADDTFRQRKYEEATKLYESVFAAAEKAGNRSVAAEAAAMAARGYLIRDKKDEGRPWLVRAKERATHAEPKAWSRYLGVLGRFQWQDDNKPEATKTFVEMYHYCVAKKLHSRAVDAAHMVGITGTSEQQVEWAKKGIEAAEAGGLDGWLGPLWNNLGVTYQEKGDWKEALSCYRKARVYHWKVGSERNKLVADWAVGMALRESGEVKKAQQWLRPVLAWAERWHSERPGVERGEWIGLACRELGYAELDLYEKDRRKTRLAEARKLLKRAKKHLGAAKMAEWDKKAWKTLEDRLAELSKPAASGED
ncbi:MAG: tetratricopeptide repeat protein [Planctomycetota bacterium]|jgi:tetratricopeptide (TPR) repeat protein